MLAVYPFAEDILPSNAVRMGSFHIGKREPDSGALALAFDNGKIQLMAHETDQHAIIIDSGLQLGKLEWCRDGMVHPILIPINYGFLWKTSTSQCNSARCFSAKCEILMNVYVNLCDFLQFLAACGVLNNNDQNQNIALVQFYSAHGHHLRSLRAPGLAVSCLTWEGSGLRMALAVESFIYFASIR